MMSKKIETKIAEIHEFVEKHVKGEHIKHYDAATYMQEVILPFNASVISLLLGRNPVLDDRTGDFRLKGNYKIPNKMELMAIMKEVMNFESVRTIYENPDKNDMQLKGVLNITPASAPLSERELAVLINGLIGSDLSPKDFAQIAMLGEIQAAARFKRKVMWIGIASVVAAICGVFFYHKMKNAKFIISTTPIDTDKEIDDTITDPDIDLDLDDDIGELPKVEDDD